MSPMLDAAEKIKKETAPINFAEAIKAYDRVVLLTDGGITIIEERDRARAYRAHRLTGEGDTDVSVPPIMDARPQRGIQDVRRRPQYR